MTEKRFTYDKTMVAFAKAGVNDNLTGKTHEFTVDEILDLLNKLNNENGQLKDALNQRTEQCDKYYKENEQLKKENQHFRKVFGNKYDAYIDGKIGGNVNEL